MACLQVSRKRVIIGLGIAFLAACAVMLWPKPPLDLSKDEAPFNAIAMPPRSVQGGMYMDGGSIGVTVTDRTGARFEFNFPIEYGKIADPYPTAFFGNINDRKQVPLKDPARAKRIAIRLLTDYGVPTTSPDEDYGGTAGARRALSNPPYLKALRWVDDVKKHLP